MDHPSIPEDQRAVWHAPAWTGLLAALSHGAWTTTDEWNRLLPDYEFTTFEQYVRSNWGCEEQGKKVHSN